VSITSWCERAWGLRVKWEGSTRSERGRCFSVRINVATITPKSLLLIFLSHMSLAASQPYSMLLRPLR